MMYVDFSVGGKEYKLRLNTRALIMLEKKLDGNPLNLFLKNVKGSIPKVEDLINVFHASLQPYHATTYEDACDLFDTWIDEGHLITDFVEVMVKVYQESGVLAKGNENEKN